MDVQQYMDSVLVNAKRASRAAALASTDQKNDAILRMAAAIRRERGRLQAENEKDVKAGQEAGLSSALIDRLTLTDERIDGMAEGLEVVASLRDPVGEVIDGFVRPNGLKIQKVRVPIGVVFMIYESRPNVTADAASLCLKAGNAVILRGGKEAIHSNLAIHRVLAGALEEVGLDAACIQLIETTDREAVNVALHAEGLIDLVIPRGGEGLIRAVAENATIPVIKHYKGVCHTYVDASADLEMAKSICMNAKVQRPGVCNAMETLLVHKAVADEFLPDIASALKEAGVEIRGCPETRAICPDVSDATEHDWTEEYLDLVLSVKVVQSIEEAIDHIARYGSAHSDAIVTADYAATNRFVNEVDSAAVYVNASTRFTDGGEFGMGAEIGISTDKLHARGPMALAELTSYKWVVHGSGQIRE